MFTLELAKENNDSKFIKEWSPIADLAKKSFCEVFWNEQKHCLADFVDENGQNTYVRPNQIFAASLPYSPINDEMKRSVIDVVERELLTLKGLRTLAPKNPEYKGRYDGDHVTRDLAYHQGTVWPWLLGHFMEAYFKIHGKAGIPISQKIIDSFRSEMCTHGICSIAEVYDGDPPQRPNGSISQAWSVAEILRILKMVEKYN